MNDEEIAKAKQTIIDDYIILHPDGYVKEAFKSTPSFIPIVFKLFNFHLVNKIAENTSFKVESYSDKPVVLTLNSLDEGTAFNALWKYIRTGVVSELNYQVQVELFKMLLRVLDTNELILKFEISYEAWLEISRLECHPSEKLRQTASECIIANMNRFSKLGWCNNIKGAKACKFKAGCLFRHLEDYDADVAALNAYDIHTLTYHGLDVKLALFPKKHKQWFYNYESCIYDRNERVAYKYKPLYDTHVYMLFEPKIYDKDEPHACTSQIKLTNNLCLIYKFVPYNCGYGCGGDKLWHPHGN